MQAIPIRRQATRQVGPHRATSAVALAAGLAAALLAFLLVRGHLTARSATVPVSVVVAAQDIPARTRLTAKMLRLRSLAPADIPPGSASSPMILVGKVTTQATSAGTVVTSDTVTAPSAALGMAFALPPSQRAVTVATDPADGVELFVRPDDHVDILATDESGSGPAEARTVLQNVRLLAVGNQTSSDAAPPPPASSSGASHVTVAVTPQQAQRLVLAVARGKIHLALRAVDDSDVSALPALPEAVLPPATQQLLSSPKPSENAVKATETEEERLPLPPLPIALPPTPTTVTVIKGSVSQTVTVTP